MFFWGLEGDRSSWEDFGESRENQFSRGGVYGLGFRVVAILVL